MRITCSIPLFTPIAKDIITQCLEHVVATLSSMDTGYVCVLAPTIVGSGCPDLEPAWARRFLAPTYETPWWSETNVELALMLRPDPLTNLSKCRPGNWAWIGTVPFDEAAVVWGDYDLANTVFDGRPLIINRTPATNGGLLAVPLLVDVVLP